MTPSAPYADSTLVERRIVDDPSFAEEGSTEAFDSILTRLVTPGVLLADGPPKSSSLLQSFTQGLELRRREMARLADFGMTRLDASRVAIEYRGFDLGTRQHLWVFAVAGGSETENVADEVLATILDLQWEQAHIVGSTIGHAAGRSTVWLFRGQYIAVDNADADQALVRDVIERDARFAQPVDQEALQALRRELGESLLEREAREEAERLVEEEQQASEQRGPGARRPGIPERVRHEVWRRDEGRCVECSSRERLEYDHIVPFSLGGADTARNLQLLCEPCNRTKGGRI